MQRLVPAPRTSTIPRTLSEGAKTSATTSGRTSIVGKFYPQKLRVWSDFDSIYRAAFGRVAAELGTQPLFPSALSIDHLSDSLVEELPSEFLGSEAFINEAKTSYFLHETLQKPAQRILNTYLHTTGRPKKLYFDNRAVGWRPQPSDAASTAESSAASRPPPKTQPDCLVLCADIRTSTAHLEAAAEAGRAEQGANQGDDVTTEPTTTVRHVHRISIAEHKAVHRLRAAAVKRYVHAIDEAFIVQLAQIARSATAKASTATANAAAGPLDTGAIATAQEDAVRQADRGPPGQVFFARALTQAFHYMVSAGIEYGYMASGDTVSFLRVPRDDPTTLYYHTALFSMYSKLQVEDGQAAAESPSLSHPPTQAGTGVDTTQLAVSMLTGLCLLAYESRPEPVRQRSINLSQVTRFPDPPANTIVSQPTSRQSSRKRQNDDDDDDNNDDDNNTDNGNDDDDRGQGGSTRGRLQVPAHRPRQPSPLKRARSANSNNDNDMGMRGMCGQDRSRKRQRVGRQYDNIVGPTLPSRLDPSTFRPIRPYCSQACLLSLMRGGELDSGCPNVILHRQALQRDGTDLRRRPTAHAITATELPELVRLQLLANAEQDCHCFLEQGLSGAIGCLFKITITGYGYTFSAKGVEEHFSGRLRHELLVYDALAALQGRAVPVSLGLVDLLLPWPMDNGALVTHMLLMSYAGRSLYRLGDRAMQTVRGLVNLENETQRTLCELAQAGFVDYDTESNGNLTWCHELRRVMRIDFDHAEVRPKRAMVAGVVTRPMPAPITVCQDDNWLQTRRGQLRDSKASFVESLLLT